MSRPGLPTKVVVPTALALSLGVIAAGFVVVAPWHRGQAPPDELASEEPIGPYQAVDPSRQTFATPTAAPVARPTPSASPSGQSEGGVVSTPSAPPSPTDLLLRANQAARTVGYRGTQTVSVWRPTGSSSVVVHIVRVPSEGAVVSVQGTASNAARAIFSGDEPDAAAAGFVASSLNLLASHYEVRYAGHTVVAGRPVDVVEACRADGGVSARFFLDEATGLLLRREVFDGRGSLVQESVFMSIEVATAGDAQTQPLVLPSAKPLSPPAGWQTIGPDAVARWRSAGWTVPASLPIPGGALTRYDARARTLADDPTSGPQPAPTLTPHPTAKAGLDADDVVVHLSFSDGVSTLSLFQQHGRLDTTALAGWTKQVWDGQPVYLRGSLPLQLAWYCRGTVFTVLTSAPTDDLPAVVAALPHCAPESDDLGSRLHRGLARVGSWLNPFD